MNDKPLSQPEAYKVADWLESEKGKQVDAALKDLWRKTPSEIADEYRVKPEEVAKAAGRK